MRSSLRLAAAFLLMLSIVSTAFPQSKQQKGTGTTGTGKKNERPAQKTEEELKKEEEERRLAEDARNAVQETDVVAVATNIVNVDAVVIDKKSGQIVTGLKRGNFAIFEDGKKVDIANFATPESPITVTVVVEYSKWSELFGLYASRGLEAGKLEVVRPVAQFLMRFIKPPDDYASVIAFDIRPTPITDFTNDPNRIQQTINILLRNNPAFRENNLYDSLIFSLIGGKGDSVVLDNDKADTANYGGMVNVKGRRRAILLIASGINTMSKANLDETRKVIQESGIPIYAISTGNLFFKLYENQLSATGGINGMPGTMDFQMAQNQMNTFARESGGVHYPITFEGEIPNALNSINAMLRNQYSLSFDTGDRPKDGKKHKLEVKVDLNGDGVYEDKQLIVQHRPFYVAVDPNAPKKKK